MKGKSIDYKTVRFKNFFKEHLEIPAITLYYWS